MDLQTRKINIINWLTQLNDEEIVSKIEKMQRSTPDWWDTLSDEEKAEIEQGLSDIENGNVKTHEEVMAKYKKWL